MASFVGMVTRQEYKTGLTLRAKVTSPQGHFHAYKDFKCMVKPNGLSDLQCVLLDLAAITNNLIVAGVIGIKNNLTKYMPADGENVTKAKYVINGNASAYIDSSGVIQKRPSYGTTDQTGTLTVIVTKGLESAERQIDISIAQFTQEEVVGTAVSKINWDLIRGFNATESTDISSDGRSNVTSKLNLPTSISVVGSNTPVTVTWSVDQDIIGDLLTKSRIDITTGAITRPSYTDVIGWISDNTLTNSSGNDNYTITGLSGQNVVRLGGFKISAEVALGSSKQTVQFTLKTLSALLTNQEVAAYVLNTVDLTSNLGNVYKNTSVSSNTIYGIDALLTILMFTRASIALLDASPLFGTSGYSVSIGANLQWQLVDSTDQQTVITLPAYTDGVQAVTDSNYYQLVIKALPTTTTNVPFCLKCTFETSGYDGNKVNISGYWKFQLKKPTV